MCVICTATPEQWRRFGEVMLTVMVADSLDGRPLLPQLIWLVRDQVEAKLGGTWLSDDQLDVEVTRLLTGKPIRAVTLDEAALTTVMLWTLAERCRRRREAALLVTIDVFGRSMFRRWAEKFGHDEMDRACTMLDLVHNEQPKGRPS